MVMIGGVLLGAFVTAIGWLVIHSLALRRDQSTKRRDPSITFIIEAWRRLGHAGGAQIRDPKSPENRQYVEDIERALGDIQLFGSAKQVELALSFAEGLRDQKTASIDALLKDLRADLRNELGLLPLQSPYQQVRFR